MMMAGEAMSSAAAQSRLPGYQHNPCTGLVHKSRSSQCSTPDQGFNLAHTSRNAAWTCGPAASRSGSLLLLVSLRCGGANEGHRLSRVPGPACPVGHATEEASVGGGARLRLAPLSSPLRLAWSVLRVFSVALARLSNQ